MSARGLVDRLLAGLPACEVIVENVGPDIELTDGTLIEAGALAVVDPEEPVVAVELLFGRLTRFHQFGTPPYVGGPPDGRVALGPQPDVTAGVRL